jgi:hypothetical protein
VGDQRCSSHFSLISEIHCRLPENCLAKMLMLGQSSSSEYILKLVETIPEFEWMACYFTSAINGDWDFLCLGPGSVMKQAAFISAMQQSLSIGCIGLLFKKVPARACVADMRAKPKSRSIG